MVEYVLMAILANIIMLACLYFFRNLLAVKGQVLLIAAGISILYCIIFPFVSVRMPFPRDLGLLAIMILFGAGFLYFLETKFFAGNEKLSTGDAELDVGNTIAAVENSLRQADINGDFAGMFPAGKMPVPDKTATAEFESQTDISDGTVDLDINVAEEYDRNSAVIDFRKTEEEEVPVEEVAVEEYYLSGTERPEEYAEVTSDVQGREEREEQEEVSQEMESVPVYMEEEPEKKTPAEVLAEKETRMVEKPVEEYMEEAAEEAEEEYWAASDMEAAVSVEEAGEEEAGEPLEIEEEEVLEEEVLAEEPEQAAEAGEAEEYEEPEGIPQEEEGVPVYPEEEAEEEYWAASDMEAAVSVEEAGEEEAGEPLEIEEEEVLEEEVLAEEPEQAAEAGEAEEYEEPEGIPQEEEGVPVCPEEEAEEEYWAAPDMEAAVSVEEAGEEAVGEPLEIVGVAEDIYEETGISAGQIWEQDGNELLPSEEPEEIVVDAGEDVLEAESAALYGEDILSDYVEEPVPEEVAQGEKSYDDSQMGVMMDEELTGVQVEATDTEIVEPEYSDETQEEMEDIVSRETHGEAADATEEGGTIYDAGEDDLNRLVTAAFDSLAAGDSPGAISGFLKALKQNPPPKLAVMLCMEISSIYIAQGRKDQALAVVEMLEAVWGPVLDESDLNKVKSIKNYS
ncbi:MAG: hypothetical protein ACOY31_03405 [Bacillota bacterium]